MNLTISGGGRMGPDGNAGTRTALRPVAIVLAIVVAVLVTAGAMAAMAATASTSATVLDPVKQAILDNEAAERAAIQSHAADKTQMAGPLAAEALPPRVAGVTEMHQGPFSGSQFYVKNFWQGPAGGLWLLVYSGGARADDGRVTSGGMRIYSMPIDPNAGNEPTFVGEFTDPAVSGALQIKSVQGSSVNILDPDGHRITFDLVLKSFS